MRHSSRAILLAVAIWAPLSAAEPSRKAASSAALAVSPDGAWIAAVNPDSGSITVLKASSLKVVREIRVGSDPRTLCFSPDSRTIAVANRGSADVSLIGVPGFRETGRVPVGAAPYGVALDERRLYVSEFDAGRVAVVDLASKAVVARVETGDSPAGLAITADRGTLLVTHFYTGRLSLVDLKGLNVRAVVEAAAGANLSQFVAISADGRKAYLPQSQSNSGATERNFDAMILPLLNVVDLASGRVSGRERIHLASAGRGANLPFAAAASAERLYVANAGSDDVVVTELPGGRILAQIDVGAAPQGIALAHDGTRLFVNNVLDGTLSVIRAESRALDGTTALTDISSHRLITVRRGILNPDSPRAVDIARPMTCASCHAGPAEPVRVDANGRLELVRRAWVVEATVPLTKIPLEPRLLAGKKLFSSAANPALSADRWISCASCHPDGGMDARTWLSFDDGPRNTPALFGSGATLPLHWSGDIADLRAVEGTIRGVQFGRGLSKELTRDALGFVHAAASDELDALAAYVASLRAPPPPGVEPARALRGAEVFAREGCATCHAAPGFNDGRSHEVGTGDPARERSARGRSFDTPSLRGLWFTAPYFHDGSAPDLERVLRTGREHGVSERLTDEERAGLVGYLLSL